MQMISREAFVKQGDMRARLINAGICPVEMATSGGETIAYITGDDMGRILDSGGIGSFEPKGRFIHHYTARVERFGMDMDFYECLDNSDGYGWMETFCNELTALAWVAGGYDADDAYLADAVTTYRRLSGELGVTYDEFRQWTEQRRCM